MRTLLLADDSVTIQRVIALTFAHEDFRVISVSDGQQAIARIAAQRPDIVLADAMLPNGDGYDVSHFVRSQPGMGDVPVLLLTGAFESVDEERLQACGASGTIDKPFEPTIVISRVKALLGLGDTKPAPAAGRMVTSADSGGANKASRPPVAPKPPVRAAAPSSSKLPVAKAEPDSPKASPEAFKKPMEISKALADLVNVPAESAKAEEKADYLDSLDSALDSLDAQLSSRPGDDSSSPRNPDPPARRSGPADPRSPGRLPSPHSAPGDAVFEVDDDWFAAADSSRAASLAEQRKLAAEMGVHDVDLPEAQPGLHPAPAKDLDFDFGLDDVRPKAATINVHEEMASFVSSPAVGAPPAQTAAQPVMQSAASPSQPESTPAPPAEAKAALPPKEQVVPAGQPVAAEVPVAAPPPAPVVVQPPEITSAMLDQIAERVAERLNTSLFADHLRSVIASTVRDTVRSVVSEKSEQLVRDEIARVRAQAERDVQ